jgi:protein TonB
MDLPVGKGPGVIPGGQGTPPMTVAAPKPPGPVRPGGDILPPTRTTYVPPVYPPIAIQAKRDGTVVLEAVIDETGTVRDVTVLRSVPLLDRAAIDAVRQWRYSPTKLNGIPVAIIMTVTVTFTLK